MSSLAINPLYITATTTKNKKAKKKKKENRKYKTTKQQNSQYNEGIWKKHMNLDTDLLSRLLWHKN